MMELIMDLDKETYHETIFSYFTYADMMTFSELCPKDDVKEQVTTSKHSLTPSFSNNYTKHYNPITNRSRNINIHKPPQPN